MHYGQTWSLSDQIPAGQQLARSPSKIILDFPTWLSADCASHILGPLERRERQPREGRPGKNCAICVLWTTTPGIVSSLRPDRITRVSGVRRPVRRLRHRKRVLGLRRDPQEMKQRSSRSLEQAPYTAKERRDHGPKIRRDPLQAIGATISDRPLDRRPLPIRLSMSRRSTNALPACELILTCPILR